MSRAENPFTGPLETWPSWMQITNFSLETNFLKFAVVAETPEDLRSRVSNDVAAGLAYIYMDQLPEESKLDNSGEFSPYTLENWGNFSKFLKLLPHAFACVRECLIFYYVFYDEAKDRFYFPPRVDSTFTGVERLPENFAISHSLLEGMFMHPKSIILRIAYILTKRLFRVVKMDDDRRYFDYYIRLRPEKDDVPEKIDSWGYLQYAEHERI